MRRATPARAKRLVPQSVKDRLLGTQTGLPPLPSYDELSRLMLRYQTKDLVNVDAASFRARIDSFLELTDHEMEGFAHPGEQRDLSVRFHWGHDHDFGEFFVPGVLGDRHVTLVAALVDWLHVLPRSPTGLKVLDIGSWTGGTSLLLHAMGAEVVAVEEVRKYAESLDYLRYAFGLDGLESRAASLYECTGPELQDAFDAVLFAGVLYHVTDPVLALRIVFNCLRDGGQCVIETAVTHSTDRILGYEGPSVILGGSEEDLSRSGWNWFLPTPTTLRQMCLDVGFADVSLSKVIESSGLKRIYAIAHRDRHNDLTRAGLSVRAIR